MKYKFKTEPWQHQRTALEVSWDKPAFALLMDYGTGKTKIIIDNAGILHEYKTLEALFIIAPNEVHEQWVNEQLPTHLPDRIEYKAVAWTSKNTKKFKTELETFWQDANKTKLKIFTMNVEALQTKGRAQTFAKNFLKSFETMLVIDESTRTKTPSAKRTKFIVKHLSKLATYRRTLTGNEITRSPFDVYMPYNFLDPSVWYGIKNYHVFKHRYGLYKKGYVYRNGKRQEYPQLIKYQNLDDLKTRINSHSILIRKEDCMDLPKKIYTPIYTEMNTEQKRLYKELQDEMYTEYNEQELTVSHKLTLATRFQQIVGGFFPETGEPIGDKNPKIERLLYDLEDIDCDAPIIIWARFTIEIKEIAKRLKKEYKQASVETFFGETTKTDRKDIMERFKKGEIDYFVANASVAGTGLNLQKAYIQYYYSSSHMAEDRWQSEDRTHRGGQEHDCLYKDIIIRGTVDDDIWKANQLKINMAEYFKTRSL